MGSVAEQYIPTSNAFITCFCGWWDHTVFIVDKLGIISQQTVCQHTLQAVFQATWTRLLARCIDIASILHCHQSTCVWTKHIPRDFIVTSTAWSSSNAPRLIVAKDACCRKQGSKARQAAAASHKQDLTLALMKALPDLIQRYQTDALKVLLCGISHVFSGLYQVASVAVDEACLIVTLTSRHALIACFACLLQPPHTAFVWRMTCMFRQ